MPRWLPLAFLSPTLVLLVVYIVYPLIYSVINSFYDDRGEQFVGVENYRKLLEPQTVTAIRNTAVWVIVAPTAVCAFGLVFAVLAERIRWASAFRLVLFMPMAISLFASGVVFRLMYEEEPERGLTNAIEVGVHDFVAPPSQYPHAQPSTPTLVDGDGGLVTTASYGRGDLAQLPLVGISRRALPEQALVASVPAGTAGELRGVVWFDALPPPGGRPGEVDGGERGLPRISVQALDGGRVVATSTTGDDGTFTFPDLAAGRGYRLRLPADNFTPPFRGHTWLGPGLITPVIIACWIWIMSGFAMTLVAAGLAGISREVLEAARVDGASEAQVLRRVTAPLLSRVLVVVFVTLVITVLKVFDLVYVIAGDSVRDDADVLALQIWRVSFSTGPEYGLGSALCVVLFALTVPAMLFNIRRFRREEP